MMAVNTLTPYRERRIVHTIWESAVDYFKNEENQKDFEKWYEERYGKPYLPKEANYEH